MSSGGHFDKPEIDVDVRRDTDFGRGRFEIGYFDHLEGIVVQVPMGELHFGHGNSFSFDLQTPEGEMVTSPSTGSGKSIETATGSGVGGIGHDWGDRHQESLK
jgi:hypothetical protein